MTHDELSDLSSIRERLRALESRIADHSRASNERHDRTDGDLKELTKTVIRLSETVAALTVSINSRIANSSPSPSIPAATASGVSGGSVALIGYYMLKTLGL